MPRRQRDEKGATAILVGLLAIVLFGFAAIAVDISSLGMERQKLHDHVDSAAHAGAYLLPSDPTGASTAARKIARDQDPAIDPDTELFCVIASTGVARTPLTTQIPSTCYPGPPPYSASSYPGLRCNTKICAIPCSTAPGLKCNTMRVSDSKDVDFDFAPIIGHPQGNTGSVASAACKGSCGEEQPNPLDVVIMADRTPSMPDAARESMKTGILETLDTMDPTLHYVSFGTIHKSKTTGFSGSCRTEDTNSGGSNTPETGTWLPVPFSKDYRTGGATPVRNNSSALVRGVSCLPASSQGGYGTHLASPLKYAARYLNSGAAASLGARPGTAKKVLILETDGRPEETITRVYSGLGTDREIGTYYTGSGAGAQGCSDFVRMAQEVKNSGVTIMTIGYGNANTFNCNTNGSGRRVREVLAEAASPDPTTGAASAASDCSVLSQRTAENTDGDFFFCAATGAELAPLFKTAIAQVTDSIKFLQLP